MILHKCSNISVIKETLNDNSQFSKLDFPAGEINRKIKHEKRITEPIKNKETIVKSSYKSIKLVDYRLGIA